MLARSKIIGLLANRFTSNYQYSCFKREFTTANSNKFIWTTKEFLWFFACIFSICIKFQTFLKKLRIIALVFLSFWLQKMPLLKCILGIVAENHSAEKELISSKTNWKHQKNAFIPPFFNSKPNWFQKSWC